MRSLGIFAATPPETERRTGRSTLGEQLEDGDWNCEAPKSRRSSFHTTHTAGAALSAAGRSSRTYVHTRPVLVLPLPGANTGTGVSSACSCSLQSHSGAAPPPAAPATARFRPPNRRWRSLIVER